MMHFQLQLQTVFRQLQKYFVLFERAKKNMKSTDWHSLLLTRVLAGMLVV